MPGPKITTSLETAELVKYVNNVWHALKVGFANEIGTICKQLDIDSHPVMDIFCQDRKLSISPTYLKPGFAFGGSCLPKDVRALTYKSRQLDLKLPIIGSVLESNELHLQRAMEMVTRHGRHIAKLLVPTLDEVAQHADVLVVSHNSPDFEGAIRHIRPGQIVVDYPRVSGGRSTAEYDGIAW